MTVRRLGSARPSRSRSRLCPDDPDQATNLAIAAALLRPGLRAWAAGPNGRGPVALRSCPQTTRSGADPIARERADPRHSGSNAGRPSRAFGTTRRIPRSCSPTCNGRLVLAANTSILEFRLGRAAARRSSGDYAAALTSVADAERAKSNRRRCRSGARAFMCRSWQPSAAIRRSPLQTCAAGVAAQFEAALNLISQAARAPAYRDSRRLYRTLVQTTTSTLYVDSRPFSS